MPSRSANTPIELWPKVMGQLMEIKMTASESGSQRDMVFAIDLETQILKHLGEPVDQMSAPAGSAGGMSVGPGGPGMSSPPSAGASPFGPPGGAGPAAAATQPGAPYGTPGGAGGAPNIDELRRILPG